LIERSKEEIANTIKTKLESVEGVKGVSQLDVRISGKRLDVNVLLSVATNLRWEESHKIALIAERKVKEEYPRARVSVNTEPLLGARRRPTEYQGLEVFTIFTFRKSMGNCMLTRIWKSVQT
jgi:divalent metal cation (Fe/Co/Zn/Cd) transporter